MGRLLGLLQVRELFQMQRVVVCRSHHHAHGVKNQVSQADLYLGFAQIAINQVQAIVKISAMTLLLKLRLLDLQPSMSCLFVLDP